MNTCDQAQVHKSGLAGINQAQVHKSGLAGIKMRSSKFGRSIITCSKKLANAVLSKASGDQAPLPAPFGIENLDSRPSDDDYDIQMGRS